MDLNIKRIAGALALATGYAILDTLQSVTIHKQLPTHPMPKYIKSIRYDKDLTRSLKEKQIHPLPLSKREDLSAINNVGTQAIKNIPRLM